MRDGAKRKQLREDRANQVAADNLKLVEKMEAIHRRGSSLTSINVVSSSKPLIKGEALFRKISLNEAARKKELVAISKENFKIWEMIHRYDDYL